MMQFFNSLITGLFLVVMSTPVAYYGYFLTRDYIMPNYMEGIERTILDEREVTRKSLLRNPPFKGKEPNIYRVNGIMTNPQSDIGIETLVMFDLSIETQDEQVLKELGEKHTWLHDMMLIYVRSHDFEHIVELEYNYIALSEIVRTINTDVVTKGYIDTVYIENFQFD